MRLNSLIKKILKEETEEWVDVSPEEYKELLKYIGDASDIKKLKEYRGKKIRITGDLDLSRRKDIENLDSIDFVDGDLNVDYSNIKYFDKNKVKGRFSYWNSEMRNEELRKERQERLEQMDELRKRGAWDVENNDDISNETEALFEHLKSVGVAEEGEDKYNIFPLYRNKYVGNYGWLGNNSNDQTYNVYNDNNIYEAAKNALQDTIDELGFEAFREHVWEYHIDERQVRDYFYEDYNEYVRQSPEDWNINKELTKEQKRYLEIYQASIDRMNKKLEEGGPTDEEAEEIKDDIYDYEQLMEDIKENPEGDYSEEEIEETIESMVEDSVNQKQIFDELRNRGYDNESLLSFVDVDAAIDYVIESDGYGNILNRYDSSDDEYKVNNTWYHVMRED